MKHDLREIKNRLEDELERVHAAQHTAISRKEDIERELRWLNHKDNMLQEELKRLLTRQNPGKDDPEVKLKEL